METLSINDNGNLENSFFLTRKEMSQFIKIGSKTNKGIVKKITMFGHFVMDNGNVIGNIYNGYPVCKAVI